MSHDLTAVEHVATGDLTPYYRNPRQGNVERIAESLEVNGQYKPIVVNKGTTTGREYEVLAGNHTLAGAQKLGWDTVACVLVDVDDEAAGRIVAADNRTADLGGYDDRLLAELLGDLPDLDGTGYDPGDLDELLEKIDPDPTGDPAGFGEPVVSYTIVFDDEAQQDQWFEFCRWLKTSYPDAETLATRLVAFTTHAMIEAD